MTPYCEHGPNKGKGHWWKVESEPSLSGLRQAVCRYCDATRTFPTELRTKYNTAPIKRDPSEYKAWIDGEEIHL